MKLDITHSTHYHYPAPVESSVNEIRLTPRTNYRQSCYHHSIKIEPSSSLFSYEDFFGNRVYAFSVTGEHRELVIHTHSIVVTKDEGNPPSKQIALPDQLKMLESDAMRNRYAEYLTSTEYVTISPDTAEYAMDLADGFTADNIYERIERMSDGIYSRFIYDTYATHVNTTVEETIQLKRGVCQDFAHLMIAACRSLGVPARYVSGYHFVGDLQGGHADFKQATHAWAEVFIPGIGWTGFDPTNNGKMNWRYVKLGHGRDYRDIVPVKGIYRGGPGQRLEVTVDVKRIEE